MLGAGGNIWSTRVAFREGEPYLTCTSSLLVHSPSNRAAMDGVYIAQRPLAWMQQGRQAQSRFRPPAEPPAALVQAAEGEGASRLRPGSNKCACAWSSEAAEQTAEGEEASQSRHGSGRSNPMSIAIGHAGSISGAGSGMQRVLGRFTVNPQNPPLQQQQKHQGHEQQQQPARKTYMSRSPRPQEQRQRPVEAAAAQPTRAAAADPQDSDPQDAGAAQRSRAARPSRILDSPVSSISLDSAANSDVPPAPRTDACGRTRGARRQQPQTAHTSAEPAVDLTGDACRCCQLAIGYLDGIAGRLEGERAVPDANHSANASVP